MSKNDFFEEDWDKEGTVKDDEKQAKSKETFLALAREREDKSVWSNVMKNEMEDFWKGTYSTAALRTLAKLTFPEQAPKGQGQLIEWLIEKKAAPKTWKEYMMLAQDEMVSLPNFLV